MLIANNATYKMFVSDYSKQNSRLASSMARLSSGQRMVVPGEAPADLGISERFRRQIRSADSASRTIQNATNMFQSADSWLQEIHNILNRMSELAVGSADGSKTQADRENLNLEFNQLKQEVARIAVAGKYNGLAVNNQAAVAFYDFVDHRLKYTQLDGTDLRTLDLNLTAGQKDANGQVFGFESSATGHVGHFAFTKDGKKLIYTAQETGGNATERKDVMILDLSTRTVKDINLAQSAGTSAGIQSFYSVDEKGRVWVGQGATTASNAGNGQLQVVLVDLDKMSLDSGGAGTTNSWVGMSGGQLASAFSMFTVYNDYMYYFNRSSNGNAAAANNSLRYIKRSLYDRNDMTVLVSDLSTTTTYNLNKTKTYSVSKDGQYFAFETSTGTVAGGTLRVVNAFTGKYTSVTVGSGVHNIGSISFDENNYVYWTDYGNTQTDNKLKRAKISTDATPTIYDIETITNSHALGLGGANAAAAALGAGMAVVTGAPSSTYRFQVGPDAGMNVKFTAGDTTLTGLGISQADVGSADGALKAISMVETAIGRVSLQRAKIGSQVSRMSFVLSANDAYKNNMASAESRIRDVDFAEETAKMTEAQILSQASLSILSQSNSARASVLSLFQ